MPARRHSSCHDLAVAIRLRIPASELKQVLFTYPTYGSDIRFMV
jgi:pyruvate/2-oxoglutarate dehydrogenase complex dihydrolipoamide dehydrogenase (E3) component